MNLRTRLALTLLVSALPEKTIDVSRVERVAAKLETITTELRAVPLGAGKIDVRDLLMTLLDGVQ